MLTKDFKEFAELLNSNSVEYLIVGGYALAAYGHPRYTGDLDARLFQCRARCGCSMKKRTISAVASGPRGSV
jgi:hypothetical protein